MNSKEKKKDIFRPRKGKPALQGEEKEFIISIFLKYSEKIGRDWLIERIKKEDPNVYLKMSYQFNGRRFMVVHLFGMTYQIRLDKDLESDCPLSLFVEGTQPFSGDGLKRASAGRGWSPEFRTM